MKISSTNSSLEIAEKNSVQSMVGYSFINLKFTLYKKRGLNGKTDIKKII